VAQLLVVNNLTKRFGGIVAVNNVSVTISKGEIVGIIGPNGAGKTTLVNCITGIHKPDAGKVLFKNEDITGLPPHTIALKGIARTWQKVRPFIKMRAIEAVMTGALLRVKDVDEARNIAVDLLKLVGFPSHKIEAYGKDLTLIEHKLVDLARALATKPELLFIDEVVAGLRPFEVDFMMKVVKDINKNLNVTLGVIEHVMRFVMNISERIVVLHEGRLIAEGSPEEVANNPLVIQAYLGTKPM